MATEEEKILSIKVDYKEAITKIADYKAKLDALKESERKYKDEVKDGTITQEEYNKNITAARLAAKEYRTAINVLEKSITGQIKTQKSNADILAEVEGLMGQNVRSIAEAEAANKALREAVRSLSDEEESAYAIRQRLNAQIDENTNYIRRNSDEYIKQKMNIGAYTESIKNAYVEIKNGGLTMDSVGIVAKGFSDLLGKQLSQGFADASHAGTRLAGVLRLVKVAFVSIPIVAVVAALAALVAAFTRTQKGMEFFQVTMAKVGAVFDVLLDRLAEAAKNITSIVSSVTDAFKKLFGGDFSGAWKSLENGANKAKETFKGMGDEMMREWEIAGKLKEALIAIEKEETMLKMSRASNKAEIEALKKVAEDITKTEKERLEAAQKAYELEQKDMDAQVKLQKSRVANMLGYVEMTEEVEATLKDMATGAISADEAISKIGISSSTIDDLKELSDAVVELYEVEESSTTRQIELQNKLNSIRKEANDAYLEKLSKETDAIREMEDALLNVIKASQEQQKKQIISDYDSEIDALKKKLAKEKELTEASEKGIISLIEESEKKKKEAIESLSVDSDRYEEQRNELVKSYDLEIEELKNRLATEKELTEQAKDDILVVIRAKENAKRALSESGEVNEEYIKAQREAVARSYDEELELLKNRLAMEKSMTEQSQNDILSIIQSKEKEKQEALAKVSFMDADMEAERKRVQLTYDREIEDLKKRLATEKDLTAKAREAITETIKAKEMEKQSELDRLNDEAIAKEIAREQKLIQLKLEAVKDGSEQEYQLKMQQLVLQRDAELKDKELTEQMKLAIVEKYNKLMNDATIAYNNEVAQKQSEALKMQFDTAIAQAYGNEEEILRLQMEQKKAVLNAMAQMEGESIEAYNLRRLQAENEYTQSKQEYADKQVEIEQAKYEAMSAITGGLIELTEAIGESNRAAAIASKVLALAQIAIDTGKAISAGVAEAVKIGFPQNLGAIATTVATVLANIAAATKAVKSAKFATGGDVSGAGTATSDSIPAMLSNGESVLTAAATNMFAPILSAFNQAGGGVPIYGQQTGNQAMGEDMLARAFAKGVASLPSPVVSVEEINSVGRRVEVIENISSI